MMDNLLHPACLFFLLGLLAGVFKSDLRLPDAIYQLLSTYLLLAIGLKGGEQLAKYSWMEIYPSLIATAGLGIILPILAYNILRFAGKMSRADSAALAAHYGSVSAVTFAVALSWVKQLQIEHEGFLSLLLVVLEIPAIVVAVLLYRARQTGVLIPDSKVLKEVFLNKGVYLLVGGMCIGALVPSESMQPMHLLFHDLFYGALAFFLLEMGVVTATKLSTLKQVGWFLGLFALGMPLIGGALGAWAGHWAGLSLGGTTVLACMSASASYIAAPAAVRIAIPDANPTYYLTASLGITFPFNLTLGIPIYYKVAQWISC